MRVLAALGPGGGQEPAAELGGAVVFAAVFDPPALQAAAVAPLGRGRVGPDDQPGQPGT
jgi:hypothetical protein